MKILSKLAALLKLAPKPKAEDFVPSEPKPEPKPVPNNQPLIERLMAYIPKWKQLQRAAKLYARQPRYVYRHPWGAPRKARRAARGEIVAKLGKLPRMMPARAVLDARGQRVYIPSR